MDHTALTIHHSRLLPHKDSTDSATLASGSNHLITAYYLYLSTPSWPSYLTYREWFTHINGYPSAAGQVQVRESSPVRDWRSSTELHQPKIWLITVKKMARNNCKFCSSSNKSTHATDDVTVVIMYVSHSILTSLLMGCRSPGPVPSVQSQPQ